MGRTCAIYTEDSRLITPNWTITDKLNARTTLSFTLISIDNVNIGDTVFFEITQNSISVYKTYCKILTIDKYEAMPGRVFYNVSAVDDSSIADKRLIAAVAENMTAGDIVRNIILPVLSADGVIAGNVQDGPIIKKAVFNYIKCSEALDYLKDITQFNWNIIQEDAISLNFYERSTNKSPWILFDSVQHSNFKQKSDMTKYRNTQYIRGGKCKTATQTNETPSPKPDGDSRNFILRYPLAEKPVIEINLNGTGWTAINPAYIGVNGIDKNKKWYFAYNSNTITQDSTEAVLTPNDAVRITYKGLRDLFVKIDNPSEINNRKMIESSSGIYENIIKETSINDTDQAIQYAQALLEKYGEIKDTIDFNTNVPGLQVGQLLTVQKPLYGINSDFLIESITIRPDGPEEVIYSVHALDGAAVGGWEEFFKGLLKTDKEFVIAENEVIILLQNQSEISSFAGQTNIKVFSALYPSESLYPSENLYPNTAVSEVIIND
ncbi:hypothetical protein [Pseudobacteroides cellulosolvens]|uniref:Uncharacterized protein n=1 Tax=Pseudobacteroides cellulosolvens ATCC 35603 = DSM 2933 TaxID=398512 RepID=A0A0L6JGL4_9FIRM|nr:hypothetical protein [Pseudobacteroides cellulosolvens]KNY24849.1 hypothetical protein Bccel_0106 [Pseudobacteroides cellulosolvens ATCC 35603 = DSM 2933]